MVLTAVWLCSCSATDDSANQRTQSLAADVEAENEKRESLPSAALPNEAATARVERLRRLLDQGIDVNKADPSGRTSLMMAAFEGYTEVVKLLLDHGAEVDLRDSVGRTALIYASSGPFPQTVKLLIDRDADVNLVDSDEGWTALMLAAAEGHQPVVEVLLRAGANSDTRDKDGDKAIDHARRRGQKDIVTLLKSRP